MHEDDLYLDAGAVLSHVILAHIWLGLVRAVVKKTWCPVVYQSAGLLPLSSQTCEEKKHREEYGQILHGKEKNANPPDLFLTLFQDFHPV